METRDFIVPILVSIPNLILLFISRRNKETRDSQEIWLPQEIWREILSRLPNRCIMRCRTVCKSWRDLIEGDGLLAKQFMAFVRRDKKGYAVANEDGRPLFQFDLPPSSTPHHRFVLSSVDGLLLLWDGLDGNNDILFVVNPMTREYIDLPPLPARRCLFGFGVSKLSGQYKILCVDESRFCHVYTLGGECSWRRIPAPAAIRLPHALNITYRPSLDYAIFLNGNIHWLACDLENNFLICCFDLETELFTSFPLKDPPLLNVIFMVPAQWRWVILCWYQLCILEGRLCICDALHLGRTKIWKMDNYGDPSSWIMEYNFEFPLHATQVITPLRVLTNGDLLFFSKHMLFIYSKNTEAYALCDFLLHYVSSTFPSIILYTPSFFSLKTLGLHNVQSLRFH